MQGTNTTGSDHTLVDHNKQTLGGLEFPAHREQIRRNKADEVEFNRNESIFYAAAFFIASIASLVRVLRDNEGGSYLRVCGRCFSGGGFGFGTVALTLGDNPDTSTVGVFYWLAIAYFVGHFARDIEQRFLAKLLEKIGLKAKED